MLDTQPVLLSAAPVSWSVFALCKVWRLIFVRNNANDTADRIEAYAKKSGMEVVETIFNTDKKAVERLRYYIERDAIICVLVRDVVDISMELNEIKAVMTLAAEHGISINAESRGYEPALISYE